MWPCPGQNKAEWWERPTGGHFPSPAAPAKSRELLQPAYNSQKTPRGSPQGLTVNTVYEALLGPASLSTPRLWPLNCLPAPWASLLDASFFFKETHHCHMTQ